MTNALQEALAARGRKWGDSNADAIAEMREQLVTLRRRPRTHALLLNKALRGRRPIGMAQGGYVRGAARSE